MNFVYIVFLALAWVGIECFVGGTRLLYSLPAYALLSIGALLSVVSIFTTAGKGGQSGRRKRIPPDALCLGSTLLLGLWIILRAWRSPVEYLAWPDFFMMVGCLMVYLLTALYLNGVMERAVLICVLWAIAGIDVWVGIVQFAKDQHFMLFGFMRPPNYLRASGMYISPNNFAGYLVAVAIISISLGIWSTWRVWAKILAIYIAVFCLVGVAVSGSRGGYFAAIGSLISFAIASIYTIKVADPRKFIPVTVAAIGGVAAILALAAFLMFHSDYLTHRMQTMVAKDVRIYNWEAALDHFHVSPWVGTGAGTHLIYGRLFRRPEIQADPVHAHCDYLELIAEYGLVGALCMLLFLAAHTAKAFRSISEILRKRFIPSGLLRSDRFALQLGALCAVAGLAVHSVVDFDMHIPGNALIFAFLFGILANPGIPQESGWLSRGLTPLAKVLLPALGLLMLWRGLPLLPSEYCSEIARASLRDHAYANSIRYAKLGIGSATPSLSGTDGDQYPPLLRASLEKFGPDPKNPNLYFYLGEASRALATHMRSSYVAQLSFQNADAAFKAGLAVFPQDESMLIRDAESLDSLRRFGDAEVLYQKALLVDPNLTVIHIKYEDHLKAEGKTPEAEALARQRLQAAPVVVDTEQAATLLLQ